MSKGKISFAAFLALIVFASGYGFFMRDTPSMFFSQFSLKELVKKNRSPSGLLCVEGGMGGVGGGGGGAGSQQASYSKSDTFSCRIKSSDADKFDEAEFIFSLKADVKKDIVQNGLTITDADSTSPSSFYFEYEEGNMRGRIEISGERRGIQYFSLTASLKERSERKPE